MTPEGRDEELAALAARIETLENVAFTGEEDTPDKVNERLKAVSDVLLKFTGERHQGQQHIALEEYLDALFRSISNAQTANLPPELCRALDAWQERQ